MKPVVKKKWFNSFLVLFSVLIPWGNSFLNIGVGILLIFSLLEIMAKSEFKKADVITFLIFSGYYFAVVFSLVYSDNLSKGFDLAYRFSPLALIPFTFFMVKAKHVEQATIKRCMKAFSISLTTLITIKFVLLLIEHGFKIKEVLAFPSKSFSEGFVNYHYLYLAYFLSVSLMFLLYRLVNEKVSGKQSAALLLMVFTQSVYLVLLGSRTSIFSVLITGFFIFFLLIRKKKKMAYALLVSVAIMSIGVFQLKLPIVEKIKEAVNYGNQYSDLKKVWGGRMMRMEIWECCMHLISEKPIFGHGIGSAQEKINNCLEVTSERPILYLGSYRFNAHSQYFQFSLFSGLFGLTLFLAFIFYSLWISIKNKNLPSILFIIISCITFLTESILQRNKGIVFFAFFSCLLFLLNNENPKKKLSFVEN